MTTSKWKRSNKDKGNNPSPSSSTLGTLPSTHSSLPSSSTAVQRPQSKTVSVALTIPEIILSIAAFISRPSLVRCTLVCKDWHVVFQPLLFRVVVAADFDRPDFVRAFQIHTRFATSIEWIQESPMIPAVPRKRSWRRFFRRKDPMRPIAQIRKPFEQLESSLMAGQTPLLGRLSVRIQNQDPNLTLRLSASTVVNLQISTRGYPARKPRMYMEDILQAYPNLINLTLEGLFTLGSHLYKEGGHLPFIPPLPIAGAALAAVPATAGLMISPAVQAPTLLTEFSPSATSMATANAKGKGVVRSSSVQTLNLRLVDISQNALIALSALLPNLTALLIEEFLVPDMMIRIYRWTWSSAFIQNLRSAFPHLQSIRFAFPFENIKEDTIVEILKAFPLLTTVGFRNAYFGKRAMETLQEHCKYVECLDVSFGNGDREFKGALLRFLQTWPRLRELEADGVIFHLDKPVDAGVTKAPWACTKLEKLVCGFHGTESMIFQHLSQFPMLSHLTIANPALTISPIESTLAWMVKSTKMQYFWFTNQRNLPLDKATIRWMLQHWPNLKKLHVAGGVIDQRETVKQWCRDAQRLSLVVEYDRM
ncbi:hypothetical protein EDD21DRAFT_376043 [Dissophora ornata]|nr:hypothetical protein EDD21DRAFT_376043 [Dissophora ornata]